LNVNSQLHGNAFRGESLGTAVFGDYVTIAPQAFVRMGPLYKDRAIFWKFAAGLGLALTRLDGELLPYNGLENEQREQVGTGGISPCFFMPFGWELQLEHWVLSFRSEFLSGYAQDDFFTYELYELKLSYTFFFN